MMLCLRPHRVNAARVCVKRSALARAERPDSKATATEIDGHLRNPTAVNLANADAGVTGTNVLRVCPTLCSHPS